MNNCDMIRPSVGAWMDGELSRSDAERVRAHLEGCLECDLERQRLEKLETALRRVLDAEASRLEFGAFWGALQRRMHEKPGWGTLLREWSRSIWGRRGLSWAVPAIIALLVGVAYFESFPPGVRPAHPQSNFAAVESINAYGRNIALLRENETRTTVIWLFQNPEADDESNGETRESGPSF